MAAIEPSRSIWVSRLGRVRPRWSDLSLLVVLFGIAQWTRYWAQGRPLWLDEQLVAMNLRARGFFELTGRLDDNVHTPTLWIWTEKLVTVLFGTGERALRLPPLLFAAATLVVAWWIGRTWLGPIGALALTGGLAAGATLAQYAISLKAYTADTFFVLLLIGLAGRVADAPDRDRRVYQWWAVALLASGFSMASIYVAAAIALPLLIARIRVGRRAAFTYLVAAGVWLASFGVQYLLSLRHTLGDSYLTNIWALSGYPRAGASLAQVDQWTYQHLAVLAASPVSVAPAWPYLLWLLVAAGIVIAALRSVTHARLVAAPIIIGFVLAWLHLVPLTGRLALWIAPPVLLAAAIAVDAPARLAYRLARAARSAPEAGRRRRTVVAGATVCAVVALLLAGAAGSALATAQRGTARVLNPPALLHDDRAVAHMISQHRPGDLVLAFAGAYRAIQWYDEDRRLQPVRVIVSAPTGPDCSPDRFAQQVQGYDRLLVYLGVIYAPYHGVRPVLERRLNEVGRITDVHEDGHSIVYTVDLGEPRQQLPAGEPEPKYNCVHL